MSATAPFATAPFATAPFATAPFAATLPAALLETILTQLAALFLTGAGGDISAARHAAAQMLAAYRPETEPELRLAANIISFSLHAIEALGQAAAPDLPMTRILRLRSSAVSLSRESHKAERRLAELQKARRQGMPAQPPAPEQAAVPPSPKVEKPIAVIQETRETAATARTNGMTWTQAYEKRQRDARIAASLRRAEARVAAQAAIPAPGAMPAERTQPVSHAP